ncbi:S49 family peptidase, partial [Francisella tularensis]|uniref:S49 family peptidase n=1 Tax=Francisella tularensis TaxID=263 RepID=UPI002381B876
GGVVNGYGVAAAQLERIRQVGINLTVCIDKGAASGGYMMSAVAHKIIAAPFAIVGSRGVVGTIPNIRALLEKNGIHV